MDEFQTEPVASDRLARLTEKLRTMLQMQRMIANMEEDLDAAKKGLHELAAKQIPDLMMELQIDSLSLDGGYKVEIKDFVSGSLPKDEEKRKEAIKWLEAHEGGDLITTDVIVSFGRKQHNQAYAFIADVQEKQGVQPDIKEGVHPKTLAKFAREKIQNGEEIDLQKLGLFAGRIAKLSKGK